MGSLVVAAGGASAGGGLTVPPGGGPLPAGGSLAAGGAPDGGAVLSTTVSDTTCARSGVKTIWIDIEVNGKALVVGSGVEVATTLTATDPSAVVDTDALEPVISGVTTASPTTKDGSIETVSPCTVEVDTV